MCFDYGFGPFQVLQQTNRLDVTDNLAAEVLGD